MKSSILSINRIGGRHQRSGNVLSPFGVPSNANNAAVALPVEILHTIFVFCAGCPDGSASAAEPNLVMVVRCPRYPPDWVAISYVCQRWRAVALDFKKLWSTLTPNLSPRWISACLERSAYAPRRVNIDVGPPPPPPAPKKPPPKKRRFAGGGGGAAAAAKRRRLAARKLPPLMALPGDVIEEVFLHAERIEDLHLEGNTADVLRALELPSLGGSGSGSGSMPLLSLSVGMWDEAKYPHFESGDEDEQDASLVLADTLFGGSAPRLGRLHLRSGLHVTFPSWVLGGVTEFAISCSFCAKRLFSALGQMPQLEVLKVSPIRRYWLLPHSDGVTVPITLKHLSLLVIEDTFLELLIALLGCLLVPADVRRHLKVKLDGSKSDTYLWGRFSSLMPEIIAGSPDPVHAIHFRREPSSTNIRLRVSPTEPAAGDHHRNMSSWPPLDDPFSLEIHCADRNCLYGLHTSYSVSFFHRLQELCVLLGGPSVQELFVEYGTEPNSRRRPSIPHRCWRTLFAGLSSVKTLRFGDGAAELLVSASFGGAATAVTTTVPTTSTAANSSSSGAAVVATGPGFLSGSLQRVTVSRCTFSTRVLWDWIHYAFARPAEWDASLLRMNVLADLSVPRWKSADVEVGEDVTESLLVFLLHCRSMGAQVSELSLVECTWNEPGGLEILRRLLHILDPEWNVILETASSFRLETIFVV